MLIGFSGVPSAGVLAALVLFTLAFGFVIAALSCAVLLPIYRRLQVRQTAYEDAPQSHRVKSGTPTMGGLCFVVPFFVLLDALNAPFNAQLFFLIAACAAIGFVDDLLGIRRTQNRGLRARTKYLLTALAAVVFMRSISDSYWFFPHDVLLRVGSYSLHAPHWLWFLLGIAAITGTIHAVNLTDGLDGLATGTMIPALAVFAVLGFAFVMPIVAQAALIGIGACLAFLLFFNRHPAKMFMGDTGSLALGALLAALAIITGEMLLLLLAGGVFVVEALSVILQVAYFKRTGGKRILRMSPLHHHFELGGCPEQRVTSWFWFASLACGVIATAVAL